MRWLSPQHFDTENKLRQGAYTLVDASLSWRVRRDVDVTLYAQSLTNRDYRNFARGSGPNRWAQIGLGRTVGVTVTFDY